MLQDSIGIERRKETVVTKRDPIISVSGLRGIIGESLTPEVAARYAASFAAEISDGPIVVTRDGRGSGRMLTDTIRGALNAMGRDVLDADIAATPTTGILIRSHRAGGGIQISASHNPAPYNGMKLFSNEGRVLTAAAGEPVLQRYRSGSVPWMTYDRLGSSRRLEDSSSDHLQAVLKTVSAERIRKRRFRVVLDSNHGAGSLLGRQLLQELGCEVTFMGDQADGEFEHLPEPTAENLRGVAQQVAGCGADVAFCQDPDADRLALIDESGRYIGEEYTLAICLEHILKTRSGPIVTNCATSRMSQDLAALHGVPFHRSKVGEANVVEVMLAESAVFGGEGNGGPIDPKVGLVRDSFVGMAQVLDALATSGDKLSVTADRLPKYEIVKSKVELAPDRLDAALAALPRSFTDAESDQSDGLRFDWSDKWLLVRGSNTEPIVRLIAEARTEAAALELIELARAAIGKV